MSSYNKKIKHLINMKLNLKKPLVYFDLETTGLSIVNDRIIEISILKLFPDGKKEIKTRRLNPTIPISPSATDSHGITDDDVKDCPTFKQVARSLITFIGDADLAGYNCKNFDIPLLVEEFLRVGIDFPHPESKVIDVSNIFKKMEERTLSAAYKFYCRKDLENAHSAEADILATVEILDAQLDRYENLEPSIDFLHNFSKYEDYEVVDYANKIGIDKDGDYVYNVQPKKGCKIKDDLNFANWMLNKDFPLDTKRKLQKIVEQIKIQESISAE